MTRTIPDARELLQLLRIAIALRWLLFRRTRLSHRFGAESPEVLRIDLSLSAWAMTARRQLAKHPDPTTGKENTP